jgi:hypothetical protein
MPEWTLPALATTIALVAMVLALRQLARVRRESRQLRERLEGLEQRLDELPDEPPAALAEATGADDAQAEFVITGLPSRQVVPARIEGRLFADIVLRETVVMTASLVHGLRRALTPENRFRMRYEMTREMGRSRKERREELRAARRYLRAQRGAGKDAA